MQCKSAVLVVATGVLFATAVADIAHAASPISPVPTNNVPKVQLNWLASLSMNPSSVAAGNTVTGTVTLLRPALENMRLSLSLDEAVPNEAAQVAPNAIAPVGVTVPVGASSATFQISTVAKQGVALPKVYGVRVGYGSESKASSFTVVAPLQRITPPHP